MSLEKEERLNYLIRRASTMATLIVAVFFGAFSLLSILFNVAKHLSWKIEFPLQPLHTRFLSIPILVLLYFGLVLMGAYLIGRWKFFQAEASRIAGLKEHDWGKKKKSLADLLFKYAEYFFIGSMILAFFSFILTFIY